MDDEIGLSYLCGGIVRCECFAVLKSILGGGLDISLAGFGLEVNDLVVNLSCLEDGCMLDSHLSGVLTEGKGQM